MGQGPIRDQLEVHYQPVIALDDGRPLAVEALLRWRHPRGGVVPAARFMAELERMGASGGIGPLVLDRALVALPALRQALDAPDLRVSVNLWSAELAEHHIVTDLQRVLRRHDVEPNTVVVEVSEHTLLDDDLAEVLAQIALLGIGLAVDDFGTAEAGFSVLDRVKVEQVKIDQQIVAGVARSRAERDIVSALVCLGHEIGLTVVAEGVEAADQARVVQDLGVDAAQGFWFGRPCPLAQLGSSSRSASRPSDRDPTSIEPAPRLGDPARLRALGAALCAEPAVGGRQAWLESILDALPTTVVVVGHDGTVQHVGARMHGLLGRTPLSCLGLPAVELIDDADRARFSAWAGAAFERGPLAIIEPVEVTAVTGSGRTTKIQIEAACHNTRDGAVLACCCGPTPTRSGSAENTGSPSVERTSRGLVSLDGFLVALDRCVEDRAAGSVVLFADIWDHAGLAAAYGTHIAEEIVLQAGAVLRANVRGFDVVGRIGDSELAVLCLDLRDTDAARLRRRLVRRLRAPIQTSRGRIPVSVEIATARVAKDEVTRHQQAASVSTASSAPSL